MTFVLKHLNWNICIKTIYCTRIFVWFMVTKNALYLKLFLFVKFPFIFLKIFLTLFCKKFTPQMQIFLRHSNKLQALKISETTTFEDLTKIVEKSASYSFNFCNNPCDLVSSFYADSSIINIPVQVLGGGKDISEEDKKIALKHISIKICRDCNGRNAIRATRCRKRSCGNGANLRPKKMSSKKA